MSYKNCSCRRGFKTKYRRVFLSRVTIFSLFFKPRTQGFFVTLDKKYKTCLKFCVHGPRTLYCELIHSYHILQGANSLQQKLLLQFSDSHGGVCSFTCMLGLVMADLSQWHHEGVQGTQTKPESCGLKGRIV